MPHYNRAAQLHNTLISLEHQYSDRRDYEIILIEDAKNKDNLKALTSSSWLPISIMPGDDTPNPSTAFNIGAAKASGKFLVITNPECFHFTNVLKILDDVFDTNPQDYVVCACLHIEKMKKINSIIELSYKPIKWFQHSVKNPRRFHFCSSISRSNYIKIGGFDERFSKGVAYDDAAFLNNILKNNIEIIQKDNAIVLHQEHSKYNIDRRHLLNKNKQLYKKLYE